MLSKRFFLRYPNRSACASTLIISWKTVWLNSRVVMRPQVGGILGLMVVKPLPSLLVHVLFTYLLCNWLWNKCAPQFLHKFSRCAHSTRPRLQELFVDDLEVSTSERFKRRKSLQISALWWAQAQEVSAENISSNNIRSSNYLYRFVFKPKLILVPSPRNGRNCEV